MTTEDPNRYPGGRLQRVAVWMSYGLIGVVVIGGLVFGGLFLQVRMAMRTHMKWVDAAREQLNSADAATWAALAVACKGAMSSPDAFESDACGAMFENVGLPVPLTTIPGDQTLLFGYTGGFDPISLYLEFRTDQYRDEDGETGCGFWLLDTAAEGDWVRMFPNAGNGGD